MDNIPQVNALVQSGLPGDILFKICSIVSIESILKLRMANKYLSSITRTRGLWLRILQMDILDRNLPIPDLDRRPIDDLSASELERCVRKALFLHDRWCMASPKPTRTVEFHPTDSLPSRCIFLDFLPGRFNKYLLSVTITMESRRIAFQCWDVQLSSPKCVAILEHVGPYGGIAINQESSNTALLAVQFARTEIWGIDFEMDDPTSAFVVLNNIPGHRTPLFLFDDVRLVTGGAVSGLDIWNINLPNTPVHIHSSAGDEKCQAVSQRGDMFIVINNSTWELYNVPLMSTNSEIYPIATHKLQWGIDSVSIAPRLSSTIHTHNGSTGLSDADPIHVLIRFNSLFPWPINLLHHFIIIPEPQKFIPVLVQSISSPVRLFAQSQFAIGPYGTALFIDSDAEDQLGHRDFGQRLAGMTLSSPSTVEIEEYQGSPMKTLRGERYGTATSVYRIRDSDGWVKVAMSEESGRIALGSETGEITLLEYIH